MRGGADRRALNARLRDENIRIAEERGLLSPTVPDKVTDLGLKPSDIRRKLRRKHGKEKDKQ